MFCPNCGSQLPEGAAFCANCGAQATAQQAHEQPVQTVSARPQVNAEDHELAKSTMIFGIIGLALSELGIPGIILSSMALNKAATYERRTGSLTGKARLGRNLGKAGKIVGIVMTIFWALYILIFGIVYGVLLASYL